MLEEATVMRQQAVAHTFFKHLGYKIKKDKPTISFEKKIFMDKLQLIIKENELKNLPPLESFHTEHVRHQTQIITVSRVSSDDFSSAVSALSFKKTERIITEKKA